MAKYSARRFSPPILLGIALILGLLYFLFSFIYQNRLFFFKNSGAAPATTSNKTFILTPPPNPELITRFEIDLPQEKFNPKIDQVINESDYPLTKEWKSYHWSGNDYSFRYPKGWSLFVHNASYDCWNCREELLLSRGDAYPSDGWGEILIYVQYVGSTKNQKEFEMAQLSHLGKISHDLINGKIAATYFDPPEKELPNKSFPFSLKNYLFYQNGFVYRFALNDTKITRAHLSENLNLFKEIIATTHFINPFNEWQEGKINELATFRYPKEWAEIPTPKDQIWQRPCTGPVIRNKNNIWMTIAFEVVDKDYKGDYCWSKGDFSLHHGSSPANSAYTNEGEGKHRRFIGTLDLPHKTDVILWKEGIRGAWKGDLFQNIALETPDGKKKIVVALINQNDNEKEATMVYDFLLPTVRFMK